MIDWIFPRHALAEQILDGMSKNLLDRVSVFAPRKRGKTEFIQHDIIPMAVERGILPVYVDFWLFEDDPAACFSYGVDKAITAHATFVERVKDSGRSLTAFELITLWGKARAERKRAEDNTAKAFERLEAIDMPILLLLDEVQHLSSDPKFIGFTKTLRSFMTSRRDSKIKGIFTGSSRSGLQRLFKETKAPFFDAAQSVKFEELGDDFVRYQLSNFEKATGGLTLEFEKINDYFLQEGRKPARLTEILKRMVHVRLSDFDMALELYRDDILEDDLSGQQKSLIALKALDFAILYLVAIGQKGRFYSPDTIEKMKTLELIPQQSKVSQGTVSNSIKRLKETNLLYNPSHGQYELESPELRDSIIELMPERVAVNRR
ncbi:hypothetical protein [Vibrio maritimus]|uniref:hypothetical protein n=1 Tax=Vibrio maritimus TaxID=990268 RepID=UPI001F31781A|nr:hypothetical protein [Vibrio maritimus]